MQINSLSQIVSKARQSGGKVEVLCVQPYDDSTLKALGSLRSWGGGITHSVWKREKIVSAVAGPGRCRNNRAIPKDQHRQGDRNDKGEQAGRSQGAGEYRRLSEFFQK